MPAAVPALVMMLPSSTNRTSGSSWIVGKRSSSICPFRQCVVQGRPSSNPAAPRMKTPLHTDSTVAPRSSALRSVSSTAGG
jgi:hypothetical protein